MPKTTEMLHIGDLSEKRPPTAGVLWSGIYKDYSNYHYFWIFYFALIVILCDTIIFVWSNHTVHLPPSTTPSSVAVAYRNTVPRSALMLSLGGSTAQHMRMLPPWSSLSWSRTTKIQVNLEKLWLGRRSLWRGWKTTQKKGHMKVSSSVSWPSVRYRMS